MRQNLGGTPITRAAQWQHLSLYHFKIFFVLAMARWQVNCTIRSWLRGDAAVARNKPARRQAVNGPPALCWQEAEPSHASTCFRQRPATFPRRLQEPPCPLGLFIAQMPHHSLTRPGSPQTHVLTYVWIRTASTSRLVDCCRTFVIAFGCRALSDREFFFRFKASWININLVSNCSCTCLPACRPVFRFCTVQRVHQNL
jgi:hypothetical protein